MTEFETRPMEMHFIDCPARAGGDCTCKDRIRVEQELQAQKLREAGWIVRPSMTEPTADTRLRPESETRTLREAQVEVVMDVLEDALDGYGDPSKWADIIVTRLAATGPETDLRAAVERLPNPYDEGSTATSEAMLAVGFEKGRAAVLALIESRSVSKPASPAEADPPCGCLHRGPCRESECGHHEYTHEAAVTSREADPGHALNPDHIETGNLLGVTSREAGLDAERLAQVLGRALLDQDFTGFRNWPALAKEIVAEYARVSSETTDTARDDSPATEPAEGGGG